MLPEFVAGQCAAEAGSALKIAVRTEEAARKCAMLWFAEIMDRRLYRELGFSSMPQYARQALGFSETRTGDFMRLARKLEKLPAVKAALPEIGYTKAREIVTVASPRTQERWVAEAKTSSRRELVKKVKRVKKKARKPAAELFEPDEPLAKEVPVRVSVEFTPEQFARWETLLEKLRKQGVTGDRAEILLDALMGKLEELSSAKTGASAETAPRGATPPVQVHVHQCPDCGKAETGGRTLGRVDTARLACDAAVSTPGKRNTMTIPPRTRREVLARDRHRCRAPGCRRTRFLEVHHVTSRRNGGTNDPANLVTLCSACHRLRHERGAPPQANVRA
jgi:5-methylcytosine-specific restriction endonuclease McrA